MLSPLGSAPRPSCQPRCKSERGSSARSRGSAREPLVWFARFVAFSYHVHLSFYALGSYLPLPYRPLCTSNTLERPSLAHAVIHYLIHLHRKHIYTPTNTNMICLSMCSQHTPLCTPCFVPLVQSRVTHLSYHLAPGRPSVCSLSGICGQAVFIGAHVDQHCKCR